MRCDRNIDCRIESAWRRWLQAALCLCVLAVIVVGHASLAAAQESPADALVFVTTPSSAPIQNISADPDTCTPDVESGAQALVPASSRSALCDQSTRVQLSPATVMQDRRVRPLLRPPIAL